MLPAISDDDPGDATSAGLVLNTQTDLTAMGRSGDAEQLAKQVRDFTLLRQVQAEFRHPHLAANGPMRKWCTKLWLRACYYERRLPGTTLSQNPLHYELSDITPRSK